MQKLIVDNFGPIKHAEIELRDFVVLIGEQASGKSTLAKLVYFFRKFPEVFEVMTANAILSLSGPEKKMDWNMVNSLFVREAYKSFIQHFGQAESLHPFKIIFYFSLEKDKWVLFESRDQGLAVTGMAGIAVATKFSDSFVSDFNTRTKDIQKYYTSLDLSEIEPSPNDKEEAKLEKFNRFLKPIREFAQTIFESKSDTIYFPASREVTVNFSGLFLETFSETIGKRENTLVNRSGWLLMKSFLDHIRDVNEDFKIHSDFENMYKNYKSLGQTLNEPAIDLFIKYTKSIIKGRYSNNGQGEKIYLDDLNEKFVFLENASSGQQESIRILQDGFLIVLKNLPVHRTIEEPESHLFPTAQKHLLELLTLVVNETHSQMFITTHSPYVLSILSNLLYAKKVCDLGTVPVIEIEEKTGMNRKTWLDKNQFAAYTMDSDGISKSIFDRDNTGLIDQNYLDQVSEDLGREFQILRNLRSKQIKEKKKNDA